MKKVFNLIILLTLGTGLLFLTSCEDDDDVVGAIEDCSISNSAKNFYEDDATRIAVRSLQANATTASDITIPQTLIDRILQAFSVVHKSDFAYADSLFTEANASLRDSLRTEYEAARDTVVNDYEIHTSASPGLESISLTVDTDSDIATRWRDGNRLTNNEEVDALMTIYGLELIEYEEFAIDASGDLVGRAKIGTTSSLNLTALANNFSAINGITFAAVDIDGSDKGNDIEVSENGNDFTIVYIVRYDDANEANMCEDACTMERRYTFTVNLEDCEAVYEGASGDAAPMP